MAVGGIEIKIGQVWATRNGQKVEVTGFDKDAVQTFPWTVETCDKVRSIFTVDDAGCYYDEKKALALDLVTLIESPNEEPTVDVVMPEIAEPDELAAETLQALGWHFNGHAWVQESDQPVDLTPQAVKEHPLYGVFVAAIEQAMYGKGERHGGARTPFLEQPWVHYAHMHGRGFLTGQAAKKLEEAASTRSGLAFETEVFGAMVYLGMSVLNERQRADEGDVE